MHLKRWFFGAGIVLGAAGIYRLVTQRQPHMAKAPSYSPAARAPQSPPTPLVSRVPAASSAPTAPFAPAASPAATAPVTSTEDLRNVVTASIGQDAATSPVAAAMATAVAESDQEANTTPAESSSPTPVIGNTHKMVYHMENDAHLPMEDNRMYFASEQEALDAGYRKAEPLA